MWLSIFRKKFLICSSLFWNFITFYIRLEKLRYGGFYLLLKLWHLQTTWPENSFISTPLTSCWKFHVWNEKFSDVLNRCQALMKTAGSKVERNWASPRCWRSWVKPWGSKGVTRHLQRGSNDAYFCDTFDKTDVGVQKDEFLGGSNV